MTQSGTVITRFVYLWFVTNLARLFDVDKTDSLWTVDRAGNGTQCFGAFTFQRPVMPNFSFRLQPAGKIESLNYSIELSLIGLVIVINRGIGTQVVTEYLLYLYTNWP